MSITVDEMLEAFSEMQGDEMVSPGRLSPPLLTESTTHPNDVSTSSRDHNYFNVNLGWGGEPPTLLGDIVDLDPRAFWADAAPAPMSMQETTAPAARLRDAHGNFLPQLANVLGDAGIAQLTPPFGACAASTVSLPLPPQCMLHHPTIRTPRAGVNASTRFCITCPDCGAVGNDIANLGGTGATHCGFLCRKCDRRWAQLTQMRDGDPDPKIRACNKLSLSERAAIDGTRRGRKYKCSQCHRQKVRTGDPVASGVLFCGCKCPVCTRSPKFCTCILTLAEFGDDMILPPLPPLCPPLAPVSRSHMVGGGAGSVGRSATVLAVAIASTQPATANADTAPRAARPVASHVPPQTEGAATSAHTPLHPLADDRLRVDAILRRKSRQNSDISLGGDTTPTPRLAPMPRTETPPSSPSRTEPPPAAPVEQCAIVPDSARERYGGKTPAMPTYVMHDTAPDAQMSGQEEDAQMSGQEEDTQMSGPEEEQHQADAWLQKSLPTPGAGWPALRTTIGKLIDAEEEAERTGEPLHERAHTEKRTRVNEPDAVFLPAATDATAADEAAGIDETPLERPHTGKRARADEGAFSPAATDDKAPVPDDKQSASCYVCFADLSGTTFSAACDSCDLVACEQCAGFKDDAHLKRYRRSKKPSWQCSHHGSLCHCSNCGDVLAFCKPNKKGEPDEKINSVGCEHETSPGVLCETWVCTMKCAHKPWYFGEGGVGTWYCDAHRQLHDDAD